MLEKKEKKTDNINHPRHYISGQFETIDVIEDWDLGFHLGNVIKYISRHKIKSNQLEDLKKAQWYLNRYINKMEREDGTINKK